eukprot:7389849-Prymnesium_polylepis.2
MKICWGLPMQCRAGGRVRCRSVTRTGWRRAVLGREGGRALGLFGPRDLQAAAVSSPVCILPVAAASTVTQFDR